MDRPHEIDLVFIHGWGLHGGIWAPAARLFGPGVRVRAVDLPGHGGNPGRGAFTLEEAAEAVAAEVGDGAVWVGWSLGGLVALQGALAGHAAGLVLVGSTPRFTRGSGWDAAMAPDLLAQFERSLAEDYKTTLNRFLALQTRGAEQGRETLRNLRSTLFDRGEPDTDALTAGLAILAETDFRPRLPEIAGPALWLHGRRDTLVPAAAPAEAAKQMPDAEVMIFDGAGHAPFLSHTRAFADAVTEFIHGRF